MMSSCLIDLTFRALGAHACVVQNSATLCKGKEDLKWTCICLQLISDIGT